MNYQQILPEEWLRKYIRCFWTLEDGNSISYPKTFKIIPDGSPGLIFQENPVAFSDKNNQALPQLYVYGQTTCHTKHIATESFKLIGIYFQPAALKTIFGLDANELIDQHADISHLSKSTLNEQLLNTPGVEQKIRLLSAFILKQAAHQNNDDERVAYASAQLKQGKTLKNIQTELNLSERSLERLFKQHIGISPKLYARINRFQSTLDHLRKTKFVTLAEVAYENDYFDQSHFIREFQEFLGASPKHFMLGAHEQVANFPDWRN
jgi:AraC-like DNA-binding protein